MYKRLDLRGGTEKVFYQTALGLRDRGHVVHLFCQRFRVPPPPGVIAHRVPSLSWPRTARLLTFGLCAPLIIRSYDCDLVISFDRLIRQDVYRSGGGPHKVFLTKMKLSRGRWKSLWYRVSPYHRLALFIERRQLGDGSRRVIAVCEQSKREFMQAYGIEEKKIVVILNGVDLERFHPRRRSEFGGGIRRELGIRPDARVVLFVGTGFRRKGLDRLLRIWREPSPSDSYLLVVGKDARLSAYRAAWHDNPHVIFVGAKPNVEDYCAAADVLVLPSVQEAFGNVVVEALAAGLPVITVAGVGSFDKVEGELRTGILQDPDDAGELREKLAYFLNPTRWPSLSRQARQIAEQYSWNAYYQNLDETLLRVYEEAYPPVVADKASLQSLSQIPPTR